MSTKIYNAWRVSLIRLNGFIDSFHDHCWEQVVNSLVAYIPLVKEDLVGTEPDWADGDRVNVFETRRRFDLLMNAAEDLAKLSGQHSFSGLDLEASLNIWVRGRYAYCIPVTDLSIPIRDWNPPPYARDYSYWDNSDRPEDVSPKEWRARKSIWKKLCLRTGKQDHNARRLCHPVIDLQSRNTQMLREKLWDAVADKLGVDNGMLDTTFLLRYDRSKKWYEDRFPVPM
jgi:hypothetical protein